MNCEINKNRNGIWSIIAVVSIFVLTIFDQFTKYLAIEHLKNKNPFVLISDVLELHYLENNGMAFGLFSGKIPFFVITCLLFLIFAVFFFWKIPKTRFYAPVISIEFVLIAGAIGNFIDRVWRGYVVDFIYVKLIDFPIFNVADIYVVMSCILLVILILFKYEDSDFKFLSLKNKEN